jgi:hypothetical protein
VLGDILELAQYIPEDVTLACVLQDDGSFPFAWLAGYRQASRLTYLPCVPLSTLESLGRKEFQYEVKRVQSRQARRCNAFWAICRLEYANELKILS